MPPESLLETLRRLNAERTSGPWRALLKSKGMTGIHSDECKIYHAPFDPGCLSETHKRQKADAEYICALANSCTKLLDLVDASKRIADTYFMALCGTPAMEEYNKALKALESPE